ncbi:LPS assembly protein LptD [Alteriqipengyuania sp. WL0013]|uniref:LPS-assembly protein LptD n=1 Tax=Alteriqipengyuania sp. WL0013 TaxID=3110773 RepID=UPI002CBDDCC5|nr:LPS assembly protein LptD [Alteriqipengyuania sp. WL0013]MEB3415658.1 LPS assembly protein LptD [Alteriqipengyuania sp. WL0013]
MPCDPQPALPILPAPSPHRRTAGLAALAGLLLPLGAQAQEGAAPGTDTAQDQIDRAEPGQEAPQQAPPVEAVAAEENPLAGREIEFEANTIEYLSDPEIVTASGNVILRSEDDSVIADRIVWNRETGVIRAEGDVRVVDPDGNQLYTDSVELDGDLRVGAMENLLLALRAGGRLAAVQGSRGEDGAIVLERAAYSACAITGPDGCAKKPSWRITADRVVYDPDTQEIDFRGAYLELFGKRVLPLPGLAISTDGSPRSGILVPNLRLSASNGLEVSGSYYWRLAENRDLTASGYLYTGAPPMVSAQYRQLGETGAFQATGYLTRSSRIPIGNNPGDPEQSWRGYVYANGRYQFDPNWSATGSIRVASDRTFLRRYDISRDDRLRSTIEVERIDDDSYLSIAGWAFQTLRFGDDQGEVPFAIPAIDFRQRLSDPLLGGKVELQANSLNILRTDGQDTQRAFAGARWDRRGILPMGQEVTVTALARGDVYHSGDNLLSPTEFYRGEEGWQTRFVALGAVDVKWPLVGEAFGGTQVLTPRVQLVASPPIRNLAIPNEDARAIDLEDSNLFALNRFPGYDRVEDGVRVTYGFDWKFTAPGWRVLATLGQSYRLTSSDDILPDGTGLSERVSDIVGRTEVRYKDFVQFTHRFRLDKDDLAVRRNEFDATVGTRRTYVEVGYLRLNRDIAINIEDLQDREELRLAGRYAFANYWSVFGSGVFNLTDREEDPSFTADGFDPLRTRLGVAYEDDCIEMGFTWRRDYFATGDVERGNTYQVYINLKNLGFR